MYKLYGQPSCDYCYKAMQLLEEKNIDYMYVDISKNKLAMQAMRDYGFKTVPQIWDEDNNHIGGYEELYARY